MRDSFTEAMTTEQGSAGQVGTQEADKGSKSTSCRGKSLCKGSDSVNSLSRDTLPGFRAGFKCRGTLWVTVTMKPER